MFKEYLYKPIQVEAKQFKQKDYLAFWAKHPCGMRSMGGGKYYLPNKAGGDFVWGGYWVVKMDDKYQAMEDDVFQRLLRRLHG